MKKRKDVRDIYVCDFCGHAFTNEQYAEEHENEHRVKMEFEKSNRPKFASGDIVKHGKGVYKVTSVTTGLQTVAPDLVKKGAYLYVLERAYDTDENGDHIKRHIIDLCDGDDIGVELVLTASNTEILYRELETICKSKAEVNAMKFVRAMEA